MVTRWELEEKGRNPTHTTQDWFLSLPALDLPKVLYSLLPGTALPTRLLYRHYHHYPIL